MNYATMGSGDVAQTLAIKLSQLGHKVMMSSRNPNKFDEFKLKYPNISVGSFSEAASFGEVCFNAITGTECVDALKALESELKGKILVDLSNPLDFGKAQFQLSVCNTDSLGEQIQRALPKTHVVKTLNFVTARLMVNPGLLKTLEHDMFICGNDEPSKDIIKSLLKDQFGWIHLTDIGTIESARAMEMLLPIWLKLWGKLDTALFNFHVVK
jgi:8-hydroxy-5-deazaflavin:NADPH oxidoreductase